MNDSGTGWAFLIFLVLVFKDFGPASRETTVHYGTCSEASLQQGDCNVMTVGSSTVFVALVESQTVVSMERGYMVKLSACTVIDAKNWTCSPAPDQVVHTMRDGEPEAKWAQLSVRPISRMRWEFLRGRDYLRGLAR